MKNTTANNATASIPGHVSSPKLRTPDAVATSLFDTLTSDMRRHIGTYECCSVKMNMCRRSISRASGPSKL